MNRERKDVIATERALIGCLLLDSKLTDSSLLESFSSRLVMDDFHDSDLGKLFVLMVDRRETGLPVDPISMQTDAKRIFGQVGTLAELFTEVPSTDHAEFYLAEVKKASKLRTLERIASEIRQQTLNPTVSPESIVVKAEHRLAGLGSSEAIQATTAHEAGLALLAELAEESGRKPVFIGIDSLDRMTDSRTGYHTSLQFAELKELDRADSFPLVEARRLANEKAEHERREAIEVRQEAVLKVQRDKAAVLKKEHDAELAIIDKRRAEERERIEQNKREHIAAQDAKDKERKAEFDMAVEAVKKRREVAGA